MKLNPELVWWHIFWGINFYVCATHIRAIVCCEKAHYIENSLHYLFSLFLILADRFQILITVVVLDISILRRLFHVIGLPIMWIHLQFCFCWGKLRPFQIVFYKQKTLIILWTCMCIENSSQYGRKSTLVCLGCILIFWKSCLIVGGIIKMFVLESKSVGTYNLSDRCWLWITNL